ncbi:unnamed protein product [Adineta steineri]|uniref:Caspase family p20 domain-containing protein n=1 Tax=Adineta steineri TaxID=433720 RepID=A0A819XAW7_9BILA|nr:unnamed protein product [Adineta steineri]CAF4139233.1 unnamed protein product [Adineta steineri]
MFDKQALVIGNDDYGAGNRLQSCVYDAETMTRSLHSIGFDVEPQINLRNDQMSLISRKFAQSIRPGAIVVFYFSGHAGEFNGKNYLHGVDSTGDNLPNVQDLLREMHQNRPRVVICILDGCRNRMESLYQALGLDGRSRLRNGLVPMGGPPSTIIAFSSAAGKNSEAGDFGENSIYTKYLLRYIRAANTDIDIVLKNAAVDVQRATTNRQIPYLYTNCNEHIYLNVIPSRNNKVWSDSMQFDPSIHQNQYMTQSIWPHTGNFSYPHYDHAGMINNQYPVYENAWYNTMMYPYTYTYLQMMFL